LKRGRAPDTTDMQALKYAAMASRFKASLLAEYHAKFSQRLKGTSLTATEALAKLETHSDVGLVPDQLINPRVVLLAESFPPSVTNTAVWLNERGIDLTLMRYQAYRTGPEQIILTVSQLYPVRKIADFEIAPHTSKPQPAAPGRTRGSVDRAGTRRAGEDSQRHHAGHHGLVLAIERDLDCSRRHLSKGGRDDRQRYRAARRVRADGEGQVQAKQPAL
jgi:hypothetical protein